MLQLLQPKNTEEDIIDGLKKSGCFINASKTQPAHFAVQELSNLPMDT